MKKSKYLELILPQKLEGKIEKSINLLLFFILLIMLETGLIIFFMIKQLYSQFIGIQTSSIPFSFTITALIISYIILFSNLNRLNKPANTKSNSLHIMLYILNKFINSENIGIVKKVKIYFITNQININLSKIITNLKDIFVPLKVTDTLSVIKDIQKALNHINKIELNESNKKEIFVLLGSIIKLQEISIIKDKEIPFVNLNNESISKYYTEVIKEFNKSFNNLLSIKESNIKKGLIKSINYYKKLLLILVTIFTISLITWLLLNDSSSVLSKISSVTGIISFIYMVISPIIKKDKSK
jgi:hypothetical protein